jgi:hypothetical protein
LRSSKFGEGATSATIKESGENADMGRRRPVVKNDAAHHSLRPLEKARVVSEDRKMARPRRIYLGRTVLA